MLNGIKKGSFNVGNIIVGIMGYTKTSAIVCSIKCGYVLFLVKLMIEAKDLNRDSKHSILLYLSGFAKLSQSKL